MKRALAKESERLTWQSKEDFDAVKPALETVIDQHVGNGVVRLEANGHATFAGDVKTYGSCNVSVSRLGELAE